MLNEFSNPYKLNESNSNFKVVRWYFCLYFCLNFNRPLFMQNLETLMQHSAVSDLGLHCLHMAL